MAHQRRRADLRQQVADGRLHTLVRMQLDESGPHRLRALHVDGDSELEDRRLPRLRESARDRLPHRGELLDLDLACDLDRRGDRCQGLRRRRGSFDVLGDDASFGAGARDRRQVDPALAGDPSRQR